MSDRIIKVSNLGKKYIISRRNGQSEGLRHAIQELATAPLRWLKERRASGRPAEANGEAPNGFKRLKTSAPSLHGTEEFWALRDVSFEIKRGEVVGIIGRNGAGKSTLLKILSRITEPTTGRVEIDGRVASLLEVGTGFHPELTGRENVFLNGAILGMSRAEIRKKFDEIVAFAEVERFLDTPVKRYSSGMYVRLAFAVAAHLEPDILIVDEVLAVGDVQFQRKCLGKMQDVSQQGRTVLFVSHNLNAVQMLCAQCIYLVSGKLESRGPTADVVLDYFSSQVELIQPGRDYSLGEVKRMGSGEARFVQYQLTGGMVADERCLYANGPFKATLVIESSADLTINSVGVTIFNCSGNKLLTADSLAIGQSIRLKSGSNKIKLSIAQLHLKPDTYILAFWMGQTRSHTIDCIPSVGEFELAEQTGWSFRKLPDDSPVFCDFTIAHEHLELNCDNRSLPLISSAA